VYSDAVFDIRRIEGTVREKGLQAGYNSVLNRAALMTAGSLLFSAAMNFGLALYFLLPVPDMPAAEQAVEYNYAVSKMTWMGYIIIGVPLLATLFLVIRYLGRALQRLTELRDEQVYMR
jgi:H+/gluconate symporter-like permease